MGNRRMGWRQALLFGVLGVTAVCVPPALWAQAAEEHGVVRENMDPAVKPGNDFFRYSNGGWIQRTEIPADRASVGAFLVLRDKSDKRVKGLVDQAVKANAAPGTDARKMADLYNSFMDEAGIES